MTFDSNSESKVIHSGEGAAPYAKKGAPMAQAASPSAQRAAARRRQRQRQTTKQSPRKGGSGIRWDRVARTSLLVTLGIVLLLYISPVNRWLTQRHVASQQQTDLKNLDSQNKQLRSQIKTLHQPGAIELEARKLGMIRRGERAYVVENPPRN
jgi:cell division protein FtsB